MAPEQISSNSTWFYRNLTFFGPALLSALLILGPGGLEALGLHATYYLTPSARLGFGALLAAIACWLFVAGKRLRYVELTSQYLLVSDGRHHISVPLSAVASVEENRWLQLHPVTVRLHTPSELGSNFTFLPIMDDQWFTFTSHPVVGRIRRMAALASGVPSGQAAT
jgi:hypothetical protein